MNTYLQTMYHFYAASLFRNVILATLFALFLPIGAIARGASVDSAAPNPDDPHLLLWLDAADAGTLSLDTDGRVSAWKNKAKQVEGKFTSSDRQRPLYVEKALGGKPTLRFDGVDDILRNPQFGRAAKAWSLLLVVTPRSNRGNNQFHGIFSANRRNADDFVTGLNVDLGPIESATFSELNLEGAKDDPGVRSLRTEASQFNEGQILALVTNAMNSQLYVGLGAENMRFAGDAENSLEEVRLGGRFFAGTERGFLDGDISEVILYDNALTDDQRLALTQYLSQKYNCASKKIEYSLEEAWTLLPRYDATGSRLKLTPIDQAIRQSHGNPSQRKEIERRLIAVLQNDATLDAKEFAYRRLIFVGTEKSVPVLSQGLVDPKLGPLAQITLEAIPGEASAAALRQTVAKAPQGRQLALIQGLGLLHDRKAIPMLAALSESSNGNIADAAAQALAQIGDPDCSAPLHLFLLKASSSQKQVAFTANLTLAFRLLEQEHPKESGEIFQMLEPLANEAGRCAILAGLVNAQPQQSASLLFQALAGKSARLRGEAAALIRRTKRGETVAEVGKRFSELPQAGQIALLDAIAHQDQAVAKPVIVEALQSKELEVRVTALSVLGGLGDRGDVVLLVRTAATAKAAAEREAAFRSLTQLQTAEIDAALIEQLQQADAALRAVAARALAARQSFAAFEELAKRAKDADATVRAETGKALQTLANEQAVGRLIQLLLEAADGAERDMFEQALIASCQKIVDPGKREQAILAAYAGANARGQEVLLPALGSLGGSQASELIHVALRDPSAKLYDSGVRALANWPDASVVPELLALAKKTDRPLQRSWAIRGIARVAPRPGQLPPPEAFAALQQAFDLADRLDDKKLVLTRMAAVRTPECLAFAVAKIDEAAFQAEAIAATVKLAEGMKESHPREAKSAFEKVLAVTKDNALRTRIQRLLSKIKL